MKGALGTAVATGIRFHLQDQLKPARPQGGGRAHEGERGLEEPQGEGAAVLRRVRRQAAVSNECLGGAIKAARQLARAPRDNLCIHPVEAPSLRGKSADLQACDLPEVSRELAERAVKLQRFADNQASKSHTAPANVLLIADLDLDSTAKPVGAAVIPIERGDIQLDARSARGEQNGLVPKTARPTCVL